jgi:glucosamine 6-phosphate synthetase-like amidotransferase/phosphosugar isomerase protein
MIEILIAKVSALLIVLNIIFGHKRTNNLFCGLIGYSGKVPFEELRFKMLYLYNESRGADSCGLYLHSNETKTPIAERIVREEGRASEVLVNVYNIGGSMNAIGHTRHATRGLKTKENAHPFYFPEEGDKKCIIGAHNGTISNDYDLRDKFGKSYADYTVDSKLLIKLLQEADTYSSILSLLGDEHNAVLFTRDDGTLYAFRMKDRPLYRGVLYAKSDKGSTDKKTPLGMYISSMETSLYAIGCENIKEFKENYLYTIENGEIDSQVLVKRDPYRKPTVPTTYRGQGSSTVSNFPARVSTDDCISVDFTKTIFLGDITDTESLVAVLLKDSNIGNSDLSKFIADVEEEEEEEIDINNLTPEQDEEMYKELKEETAEYLRDFNRILERRISSIKAAHKRNIFGTVESELRQLENLSKKLENKVLFLQTEAPVYEDAAELEDAE